MLLLLWYYLLTAPTTPPAVAVEMLCIWTVLTADMKPATVRLLARLDAYKSDADVPVYQMIRTRMRQVIELICKHPKMRRILRCESPYFHHWHVVKQHKNLHKL